MTPRAKALSAPLRLPSRLISTLIVLLCFAFRADAAFINFDNCLAPSYRDVGSYTNASDPVRLQFVPLFYNARFIDTNPNLYTLNITIYGNVTGQTTFGLYPSPESKIWSDDNDPFGKLVNFTANANFTTLSAEADVLSYTPWPSQPSIFCDATVNASCPVGPAFFKNASDPYDLPAFSVARNFTSSYAFTTFASTIRIVSGDSGANDLACITANITPDLGSKLANTFTWVPAVILIVVAIATALAARFSPWSSPDVFYWSSNFGRDPDLLRLITPGFGDCLQYIQFIVLAGSLTLNYPGYYQPVISQASWSVLMFNESFVTGGSGMTSLSDGIYFSNGSYGLTRTTQLVGMNDDSNAWAGMAIWLLVIIGIVVFASQAFFLARHIRRRMSEETGNEVRTKNIPFTVGMIVRLCFNYFNLPILSLSLFQLVIAPSSPASVVACAVIMLVAFLACAGWIFRLIFSTKPRIHLFDHLPTLLTYGPLYNTYSDEAAPFAFIPVSLNFIRGAAIGAVQPSGIAQIVLLAICEVIFLLTLHAFRPFNAPTSMNAYHTFFSIVRLITTLLMIAFAPTVNVSEATKGWLGYAVLLLHAIVLIFGFFLNAILTLIEVAARSSSVGAGNRDARGGLSKVFGMRQLSKRARRSHNTHATRSSMTSDAAILSQDGDAKSIAVKEGNRSRSLSASSAILLQSGPGHGHNRTSTGLGSEWGEMSPGPSTPGATSPTSHYQRDMAMAAGALGGPSARRGTVGSRSADQGDAFYRPPRARRPTLEPATTDEPRSPDSADMSTQPYKDSPDRAQGDAGEGSSSFGSPNNRSSINPAFLRASHYSEATSDPYLAGDQRPPTDYAVRESDFYYGVRRGPALSSAPARRLKTGPADPVGPISSATGWLMGLFGGGKKENNKGFEVVRSRPFPLAALDEEGDEMPGEISRQPYRDSPDSSGGEGFAGQRRRTASGAGGSQGPAGSQPQLLGPIDLGEDLKIPSRIGSRSSHISNGGRSATGSTPAPPNIPRRSSKRTPSMDAAGILDQGDSRPQSSHYLRAGGSTAQSRSTTRLPFGGADFAPDGSSNEVSPSRDGTSDSRHSQQGAGAPNFRESIASSIYPISEGGTPIAGGEGAGVDDHSLHGPSRGNSTQGQAQPPQRGRGLSGASAGRPSEPDRPMSTGRVVRHVASDSVRNAAVELGGLDSGGAWRGEQAEVVESSPTREPHGSDHRPRTGPS